MEAESEDVPTPKATSKPCGKQQVPRCGLLGCRLPDRHHGLCDISANAQRGYCAIMPSQVCAGRRIRMLWVSLEQEFDGIIDQVQPLLDDKQRPSVRFLVKYDDGDRRWHTLHDMKGFHMKLLKSLASHEKVPEETVTAAPPRQHVVTHSSTGLKLALSSRSSTGYLGVCVAGDRFRAKVSSVELGMHPTAVDAAVAVTKYLDEHGGSQGCNNQSNGENTELEPPDRGAVTMHGGVVLHLSEKAESGYKGVYALSSGRYEVRAKHKHIGRFDSKLEAAKAYAEYIGTIAQDEEKGEGAEEETEGARERRRQRSTKATCSMLRKIMLWQTAPAIWPTSMAFVSVSSHKRPPSSVAHSTNPLSSTGYVGVNYRPECKRPYMINGVRDLKGNKIYRRYAASEEAAYAIAIALGPPGHDDVVESSNGICLIHNHTVKTGYLWVKDGASQGCAEEHRYIAQTPTVLLGHFSTAAEAAVAVSKHVMNAVDPSIAALFKVSGHRRGGKRKVDALSTPEHVQRQEPQTTPSRFTSVAAVPTPPAVAPTPSSEGLVQKAERVRQTLDLPSGLPMPTVLRKANELMGLPNDDGTPLPAMAARLIQALGI